MILRKLEKEEHGKTRKLWEQIFTEDTKEFLDYYYSVKTVENEIYVIEEDGEIRAMLHLNPYEMQVGNRKFPSHYIVAVATEEAYRRRRYMAKLLGKAMEDMRENGEVFTFLMPAAEAIYYPHGFRFVYRQKQAKLLGRQTENPDISCTFAKPEDCEELAEFADRILQEKYEIYTKRDRHYYEKLLKEYESENGGLLLVKEEEELAGFFAYGKDAHFELVEPLFREGKEELLRHAISFLTQDETTEVHIAGCMKDGMEKPMIMARILNISEMLKCMEAKEEVELLLTVMDEPEGRELGTFYIFGKDALQVVEKRTSQEEKNIKVASVEIVPERIAIGDLTGILFGYLNIEEMNLTEYLSNELRKIRALDKIFLNEIV